MSSPHQFITRRGVLYHFVRVPLECDVDVKKMSLGTSTGIH